MSQKDMILRYLKDGNSITPIEALNMFGSFRLSAIIFDLKKDGYNIKANTVKKGKKTFASYRLIIGSPYQDTLSFTRYGVGGILR